MSDFQFVVTLLSSAGVSGLLAATLIFLCRGWITERLKNAIAHEYSAKLETHKSQLIAQQQLALEQLRIESSRELERLKHNHEVEVERVRTALQSEQASGERVRAEIVRWANPILGAVEGLATRLSNIIEYQGYQALNRGFSHPQWSMTYDYFMNSTLYIFAAYFCWVRMLEQRMSFELFGGDEQKETFFNAFAEVAEALRSYPPSVPCSGKDVQVFALQQRAIGERMMREINNVPMCMSYDEFEALLGESKMIERLAPLRALLEDLLPDEGCRWTRVAATLAALRHLQGVCREILDLR